MNFFLVHSLTFFCFALCISAVDQMMNFDSRRESTTWGRSLREKVFLAYQTFPFSFHSSLAFSLVKEGPLGR